MEWLKNNKFIEEYIMENYSKISNFESNKEQIKDDDKHSMFLSAISTINSQIITPLEEKLSMMIYGEITDEVLYEMRDDFNNFLTREKLVKSSQIYSIVYYIWLTNQITETSKYFE